MDLMECLAEIMIKYYKPIEMIEHKYKTKVTAIGLLKNAQFHDSMYLDFYYQRLVSYKGLIKDHTDNFKLAENIALGTLIKIISDLFSSFLQSGSYTEVHLVNNVIRLVYPKFIGFSESNMNPVRESFLKKFGRQSAYPSIAKQILKSFFQTPDRFDLLADKIVKMCLVGVSQEEVGKRIKEAIFNFYVYGIYSRLEVRNIYMINMQSKEGIISMKYFTRMASLARSVINKSGDYLSTVNYFGKLWDPYDEVRKLFKKYINIKVMFY